MSIKNGKDKRNEKFWKKISAFATAVMMSVSLYTPVSAAEPLDREASIQALMDKQDSITITLSSDSNLSFEEKSGFEAELNDINEQLTQLGVEALTTQEVLELYGNDDGIITYASTPQSDNITWYRYPTTEITRNGIEYSVDKLTARVKAGHQSVLWETGSVVLRSGTGKDAISLEVLGVTANKAITLVCNQNTVTKIFKTFYDYAATIFNGYPPGKIVKNISATYTYNAYTSVGFMNVRKKGEPETAKPWTYIATKCEVTITSEFPIDYNGSPDIKQFKDSLIANNDAYLNNTYAVNAYKDPSKSRNYVEGLNLYGLDGRKLVTVSKIKPDFPAQIT